MEITPLSLSEWFTYKPLLKFMAMIKVYKAILHLPIDFFFFFTIKRIVFIFLNCHLPY